MEAVNNNPNIKKEAVERLADSDGFIVILFKKTEDRIKADHSVHISSPIEALMGIAHMHNIEEGLLTLVNQPIKPSPSNIIKP